MMLATTASAVATTGFVIGSVVTWSPQTQCETAFDDDTKRPQLTWMNQALTTTSNNQSKRLVKLQPRMTSMGRFAWLSETVDNPSVPAFVIAMVGATPFTANDFQRLWQQRNMAQRHVRFQQCLLASDFFTDFTPTQEPLHHHVTETLFPLLYRTEIQDRLLQLVTKPFPVHDMLWKVQVSSGGAVGQSGVIPKYVANNLLQHHHQHLEESLVIFSAHHALADGVSLTAAFTDLCDEGAALQEMIQQQWEQHRRRRQEQQSVLTFWRRLQQNLLRMLVFAWKCLQALMYQFQVWLVSPSNSPLETLVLDNTAASDATRSHGRRTLSWSQVATVEEMNRVARSFGKNVTINDVMVSCVSAAIAKLLQHHRKQQLSTKLLDEVSPTNILHQPPVNYNDVVKAINVVIPVHLGGGVLLPGKSLGNNIGAMLARIPCELVDNSNNGDDPSNDASSSLHRLQQVHSILYHVKQNPAAMISHITARSLASPPVSWIIPRSLVQWMFTKSSIGATCAITNVRGPPQGVHIEGRRIVAIQPVLPLPPGIPVGVALFSYAGTMNISVHAQAWAVPNADQFLLWIVEEYQRLLQLSTSSSLMDNCKASEKK